MTEKTIDQGGDKRCAAFKAFIQSNSFPCVGAKAALVRESIVIHTAAEITSPVMDIEIRDALTAFAGTLKRSGPIVQSCAVIFSSPDGLTEKQFEDALWNRLQCLHNMDVVTGKPWNEDVESDPDSAHFSMSIAGEPYFVVGLHPKASRAARRFDYPAMVFNSHEQFERLREDGRFEKMQSVIRERDASLDGDINPMLKDFGEGAEAAQYSGRVNTDGWDCPLDPKTLGPS